MQRDLVVVTNEAFGVLSILGVPVTGEQPASSKEGETFIKVLAQEDGLDVR